jgi:serine/threonine protein phosphatase PrpC
MHIQIGPAVRLGRRDTVLLSSDGLADNLSLDQIVEAIRRGPLGDGVARLAARAKRRMAGHGETTPCKPDDLTIVAWRAD